MILWTFSRGVLSLINEYIIGSIGAQGVLFIKIPERINK